MRFLPFVAVALALPAAAASAPPRPDSNEDESAALALADRTAVQAAAAQHWHLALEGAWSGAGTTSAEESRVSLDLRVDAPLADRWRFVVANRLDARRPGGGADHELDTLKETYLAWQPTPAGFIELGRVNLRSGVAYGYNPSDYFRRDAIRSVVSIDPSSLRENRLGTVMARGDLLWSDASLRVLYAPAIAETPTTNGFSPDFGATNARDRWQVAYSRKLMTGLRPEVLVSGTAGESPTLALNLTRLLGDATVLHLEAMTAHRATLLEQALAAPGASAWRPEFAAGFTSTLPINLALTVEYEFNGAALDRADWDRLARTAPGALAQYLAVATTAQELPGRRALFLRAAWQDAFVRHLDLASNDFANLDEHGRLYWFEARYHWSRVDAALQWQHSEPANGTPAAGVGAATAAGVLWEALVDWYF